MYFVQEKPDIVSMILTFFQKSHKMRERKAKGECDMIFQNNKKAWVIFAVTLVLSVPAFFMLKGDTQIFVFPAIQAALLLLGSTEFVKTWCMNYKLSVMRSENQYYLMLFLGVLLMLFVGIGHFYNLYIELTSLHTSCN